MKPIPLIRQLLLAGWMLLFLAGCGPGPSTPVPGQTPYSPPVSTSTDTPTPAPSTSAVTPVAPSYTPSPAAPASPVTEFTGSVQIEGGPCCIGGTMGDTIQVHVQLSAASPFGNVTLMRVRPTGGCSANPDMESAAWEPFAPSRTFPVQVALNWIGFYVSAQFQDEHGNLSPVYCDDISVEGMPPPILVNPTDWYPQIQCFSETEVHPGPGETVAGPGVTFSWPDKNDLPEGVFYSVSAFSSADQYTGLAAGGSTRETSITLQIPPDRAGDIVWYITLADANGNLLDHARCSSFPASLLTVDPPTGIKGIHFWYRP